MKILLIWKRREGEIGKKLARLRQNIENIVEIFGDFGNERFTETLFVFSLVYFVRGPNLSDLKFPARKISKIKHFPESREYFRSFESLEIESADANLKFSLFLNLTKISNLGR